MKTRAFSLVEVLTVMLIIAIVAAATFPVLFQVKGKAKQTVCISNLHQTYLGILQYQNDYDGALPALAVENPDWYINYGGGTMLKCPAGKYPEWSGYVITAGTGTGTDAGIGTRLAKEWADCRAKRGDAFPWVYDAYHHMRVDATQGGGRKVLLVRANGSAQTVAFREWGPWAPCARDIMVEVSH